MGKIATNTDIQIKILTKRGMILDYDESKIKEFLLDIGYYRLGFYWNPFEKDGNHNFVENTKFSDVIKLYYLDVDLRNILSKYLNRIEVNFRTKVVYYASNKHKDSPTWFADPSIVNREVIDKIGDYYHENFIRSNKPIKNHHKKYINDKYAPAWKTIEFFTFGTVLSIFRNLKNNEIQERISKEFGILNLSKFINLLEKVILVRNICAHGGILFDMRTPKGLSVLPDITYNNKDRSSLDSCIKVISFLIKQISVNRHEELTMEIRELFESHKENDLLKSIIENKINYVYEK
ncbi:Abi family protein [Carboxylicivirga caseinilyticus]|uniref:Abi family protein n=1 Tax=Carboxylicivirga caseinilyticus TaxID=3417572 RepID=UPI003D3440D4|nr:Abi family protein [Marinilabiliaceae bacterium A049]